MLLVDERPEEVTDMRRCVKGDVIASSLDRDVESHVRLSQLVVERCKRLAEMGKDVFLLMDSITRMARAFNKWVGNTGRTMSGGVDIKALDIPKKLFATARVFEEGGSLTIVATALIDTGSRMDELIFQEFKGTGNMELVLDRKLADRRVWPAIDISQSGTRREEKLLDPETLHAVTMLRRTLSTMHHVDAMEQLTKQAGQVQVESRVHQADQRRTGRLTRAAGATDSSCAGTRPTITVRCVHVALHRIAGNLGDLLPLERQRAGRRHRVSGRRCAARNSSVSVGSMVEAEVGHVGRQFVGRQRPGHLPDRLVVANTRSGDRRGPG